MSLALLYTATNQSLQMTSYKVAKTFPWKEVIVSVTMFIYVILYKNSENIV